MNAFRSASTGDSGPSRADRYEPESWVSSTQVATQFTPRGRDSLSDAKTPADPTIGKAVGGNTWELFVSCLPADALEQQFDLRSPYFIALHDLQGQGARRLLMDIAGRLKAPIKRLLIRRQGFGTELATLYFFDLQASNGQPVRVYCTDAKSDDVTRNQLRKVLIARSRMCVVAAPAMGQADLDSAMISLAQTLQQGRARSGALVFVPLADSTVLAASIAGFSRRVVVPVSMAPASEKAVEAWPFLVASWNKLHASTSPETPLNLQWLLDAAWPDDAAPPADRSPAQEEPSPLRLDQLLHLNSYANGVASCKGVEACCIFNVLTLQMQARAGRSAVATDVMMRQGRVLVATMQASSVALGLGKVIREGVIKLAEHFVVLRLIRGAPNMLLMVITQYDSDADLAALKAEISQQDRFFKAAIGR
ncbi:MAG TPA: hypothetical protein VFM48_14700 [Aquabacterium sp.]|nr:hypothetical protein [Aquabacterium sp.]